MSSSPTECVKGWMVGGRSMAEWWNGALQRMLEVKRRIKEPRPLAAPWLLIPPLGRYHSVLFLPIIWLPGLSGYNV